MVESGMKPLINKPKGIAKATSKAHEYEIGKEIIQIKAKHVIEKEDLTDATIKKGEGPQHIEESKESTIFAVFNSAGEQTNTLTQPGNKTDADCLAELGYYLWEYDEIEEAKKIKRLVDIGRFL